MEHPNYALARAYVAAVEAGELPDALCCDDMTAWLTSGQTLDKTGYQGLICLLASMCREPIRFTIGSLTAEHDRVIIEARSTATLINGEAYANTYIFVIRVRNGKFAHIAEHYNALVTQEKLSPLMKDMQVTDK